MFIDSLGVRCAVAIGLKIKTKMSNLLTLVNKMSPSILRVQSKTKPHIGLLHLRRVW